MGVQRSYTPLMLTLTIGLVFQFVFSSVLMEPWPMAYVEREEYANLYISCKVGIIQTVNATLVRLPNAEKCKGASFNDGTSICKSESQMITQKLQKICTGRRDCTYVLEYRISCDSLEPDRSPLLLRVRYECDTEFTPLLTTPNPATETITQESAIPMTVKGAAIGGALVGLLTIIITVVVFVVILQKRKRFHPCTTSNDYSTCLRHTPVEATTNSGYYEEIQTTETRGETVTGNGNNSTMIDLRSGKQEAEYESIDDVMPRGRKIACTDGTTYDDVVDGTPIMSSCEKVHEPVILMTPDAETIIIDNCIYEGAAQE